jgi:hypothetical protein
MSSFVKDVLERAFEDFNQDSFCSLKLSHSSPLIGYRHSLCSETRHCLQRWTLIEGQMDFAIHTWQKSLKSEHFGLAMSHAFEEKKKEKGFVHNLKRAWFQSITQTGGSQVKFYKSHERVGDNAMTYASSQAGTPKTLFLGGREEMRARGLECLSAGHAAAGGQVAGYWFSTQSGRSLCLLPT